MAMYKLNNNNNNQWIHDWWAPKINVLIVVVNNIFTFDICIYTYVHENCVYIVGKRIALKRCQIWSKVIG